MSIKWSGYELVHRFMSNTIAIAKGNDFSHDVTVQAIYGVAAYLKGRQAETTKPYVEIKLEDGSRLRWIPAEGDEQHG